MRPMIPILLVLLPTACASSRSASRDTALELNADRRYAHDASGNIVFGPSFINQRVDGQRDLASNVHVTTDLWFLTRADQLACLQISLAELASERAESPEARQIAMKVAADQQRIEDRLRRLAGGRGISLSGQLAPSDEKYYHQLSMLTGRAFDRAYLDGLLAYQNQELHLWDDVLTTSPDRGLSRFALETQPLLQRGQADASITRERL
jgi:predicted outer membrane protein